MLNRNYCFRFLWALSVALWIITFFTCKDCSREVSENPANQKDSIVTLVRTDTFWKKGDPYPVLVYDTVPEPVEVSQLEIPGERDADSVMQAFFTALTYEDSVRQDSSFMVRYRLHLSRNRLDSLKLFVQNLRPVQVISNQYAVEEEKVAWYIGGNMGGNSQAFVLAPSLMYRDRQHRMYQLQYDVMGKNFLAGIHFKLK